MFHRLPTSPQDGNSVHDPTLGSPGSPVGAGLQPCRCGQDKAGPPVPPSPHTYPGTTVSTERESLSATESTCPLSTPRSQGRLGPGEPQELCRCSYLTSSPFWPNSQPTVDLSEPAMGGFHWPLDPPTPTVPCALGADGPTHGPMQLLPGQCSACHALFCCHPTPRHQQGNPRGWGWS